jgi:hypothetical protein
MPGQDPPGEGCGSVCVFVPDASIVNVSNCVSNTVSGGVNPSLPSEAPDIQCVVTNTSVSVGCDGCPMPGC